MDGEYEVDAANSQLPHGFSAITLQPRIRLRFADELFALVYFYCTSLLRVGIWFFHAKPKNKSRHGENSVRRHWAVEGRRG